MSNEPTRKSLYQMAREMNESLASARIREVREQTHLALIDATWCEYCPPKGHCSDCGHDH